MRAYQLTATAIGLSFMFAMSGAAFAKPEMSHNTGPAIGTTSGPADGDNVSTAPQTMHQQQAQRTEDDSGGPGVEGKPGDKSGPSVKPNNNKSGSDSSGTSYK